MAYLALILGFAALAIGITGKFSPTKRPALYDPPRSFHRVIYISLGLIFSGFGLLIIHEAHKN